MRLRPTILIALTGTVLLVLLRVAPPAIGCAGPPSPTPGSDDIYVPADSNAVRSGPSADGRYVIVQNDRGYLYADGSSGGVTTGGAIVLPGPTDVEYSVNDRPGSSPDACQHVGAGV